MSGRLVLVVGSQCDPLGMPLSMLPSAAHDLGAVLTSQAGRCAPALASGPVLVDPTADELDDALVEAMRAAHDRRATLVLAFIGHGGSDDDDFYLMAADSLLPDSRRAVLVGQRLKELLRRFSAVDGLLLLIDACHSGLAVDAAGRDWLRTLRRGGRRVELFTATDEGLAFGACTSRTLTRLILTGSPQLGERLRFAEIKGHLDERCRSQVATHLAYDGTRDALVSDPTAWIALNPAWRSSPLADTTGTATIERLTRHYEPTEAFAELRGLVDDGLSCVVVSGPSGSGKSTTVAELSHPRTAAGVHAAVFLSGTDTVEQVAAELARQLRGQDLGFDDACDRYWDGGLPDQWPRVDALDVQLLGPLRHVKRPVRIVIDGIDAYDDLTADRLLAAVAALANIDLFQVIVTGTLAESGLPHVRRIPLGTASESELVRYAHRREVDAESLARLSQGGWRAADRLADGMRFAANLSSAESPEGYARRFQRAGLHHDERVRAIATVLLAAGVGAVLPIRLLAAASRVTDIAVLRDLLFRLGPLVLRGRPGDDDEHVGLADPDIVTQLRDMGIDEREGHAALAVTIPEVSIPETPSVEAYAVAAHHRHLWACGRHTEALDSVEAHESPIPAENRARWDALVALAEPGPLQRRARARSATWTAKAGEPESALPVFLRLLDESPADDIETLSLRNNLAYWTGETGDWPAARDLASTLVADCARLLGDDHAETLSARHLHALATAKVGLVNDGLNGFRDVLEARDRVMGPTHIDTLRSRHNLLYWEAETTYPPPVVSGWSTLVTDLVHSIGSTHPETLAARYHRAMFRAKLGEVAEALADFRELLPEVERVLGPWHPDLRGINAQLVFWSRRPD